MKGVGQGCLRVNCKFFHGTEEQLAELRLRCLLDEPLAAGLNAVGVAKRRKMAGDVCNSAKRPIVCLNYLTDTCQRPNCRFLHLPAEIRPLPMNICEYYIRGNCTRQSCRFFHGSKELLSQLHADGVTMYNPITNLPYDPKASLDDLIRGQSSNRLPPPLPQLSACAPPQTFVTQQPPTNTVFIVLNQQSNSVVQMHMVTQQPDGSVVIQQSQPPQQPPQYAAPRPQVQPHYAPIHYQHRQLLPYAPYQQQSCGYQVPSYPPAPQSYFC
eukprot:GILJ01014921.1.p1 GENE.GILJ01014921.1~~GILJ01014921.1.p1  ORF type:complete len:279 (+),score=18.33 GILJ01014921.1:33-839(+)